MVQSEAKVLLLQLLRMPPAVLPVQESKLTEPAYPDKRDLSQVPPSIKSRVEMTYSRYKMCRLL